MFRTLVVIHLYYPQLWKGLLECVRSIDGDKDVVVTYADESAVAEARRDLPAARFLLCENRGFDVWPFLFALQQVRLSDYALVVKLHTKRDIDFGYDFKFNGYHFNGPTWRNRLLSFCATSRAWARTKRELLRPGVGMAADRHVIVGRRDVRYDHAERAYDAALAEINALGGRPVGSAEGRFVAGTMFAAKTEPLKFLLKRSFAAEMFPLSEHVKISDCQYAHVVERMLGLAVGACGQRIAAANGLMANLRTLLSGGGMR